MCLAQSIQFMHDVIVSREVTYAVAEGDIGRVYEGLKVRRTQYIACVLGTLTIKSTVDAIHVRWFQSFEICQISS
jgi:hypothetical protein